MQTRLAAAAAALTAELRSGGHDTEQEPFKGVLCRRRRRAGGEATLEVIVAVIAALRRRSDDTDVLLGGCDLLWHLTYDADDDIRMRVGAVGAIDVVVSAMRAHPADELLQCIACGAIESVVRFDAENRAKAAAAGAMEAAVAALAAHAGCANVQRTACSALAAVTYEDDGAHAVIAVAAGAGEAAITAMRVHHTVVDIQIEGCSVLSNIARHAFSRKRLLGADAVAVVAAAMRTHAANEELQGCGCNALGNLLDDLDEADSRVFASHIYAGVTAVVGAMRGYRAVLHVQLSGCCALHCMAATNSVGQVAAASAGGIKQVVAAMQAHLGASELQSQGCVTLNTICVDTGRQEQAYAAGACEAVVAALRAYADDADMQHRACDALRALTANNPRNQIKVGVLGGVEAVVEVLRCVMQQPHATVMQQIGCLALNEIARGNRGNQRRAVAAGAIEAVVAATTARCRGVAAYGCCALEAILQPGDESLAVRAGALEALNQSAMSEAKFEAVLVRLIAALQATGQQHDSSPCMHPGCMRCAGMRARGAMCAYTGCCARKREGGGKKKLLRCGACGAAAYCGTAHQRDDWARHKLECATRRGAGQHDKEEDGAGSSSASAQQ